MKTLHEHHMGAVRRMAHGVLQQAIDDLDFDPTPEEQAEYASMLKAEARAWFVSDLTEPGSFLWVCSVLRKTPDALRAKVMHRD